MIKSIILFSALTCFLACGNKKEKAAGSNVKFDKTKWQTRDGAAYPYREAMIQYLIDSVQLKNISYDSLIKILGVPDRVNEGHLYYDVSKKQAGAVTLGTKAFVIKLKPDSTVEWRKTYGM
jgi:hypothetical protein